MSLKDRLGYWEEREKDGAQDTISMLKAIEVRMERYLSDIAEIPSDVLMEAEKAREKERRQKARERKVSDSGCWKGEL